MYNLTKISKKTTILAFKLKILKFFNVYFLPKLSTLIAYNLINILKRF